MTLLRDQAGHSVHSSRPGFWNLTSPCRLSTMLRLRSHRGWRGLWTDASASEKPRGFLTRSRCCVLSARSSRTHLRPNSPHQSRCAWAAAVAVP